MLDSGTETTFIRRVQMSDRTALNQTYRAWPVKRRIIIDYFAEEPAQARSFEDHIEDQVRSATSVAVHRVRIVHHEHVRSLAHKRA